MSASAKEKRKTICKPKQVNVGYIKMTSFLEMSKFGFDWRRDPSKAKTYFFLTSK